jgi:hypothetical protein
VLRPDDSGAAGAPRGPERRAVIHTVALRSKELRPLVTLNARALSADGERNGQHDEQGDLCKDWRFTHFPVSVHIIAGEQAPAG